MYMSGKPYAMQCLHMVQLKGNLMPARGLLGETVRVNLQTGTGASWVPVTFFTNPVGTRFNTSFLNTLILTIVQATDPALFIHSSL